MNNYERRQAAIRILRELQSLDLRTPQRHPATIGRNPWGDSVEIDMRTDVSAVALFQLQEASKRRHYALEPRTAAA